ncbi:uncharacterized protein [Amphiura filiformis]|uniref:uncharacterized protein n=1 Tax=Amphiura filiformis TaxID=82378 RepID=UPI003B20C93A
MNIGKGVINKHYPRILPQTWHKLRALNILANETKRGCRGGINKKRSISVRITARTQNIKFQRNARWEEKDTSRFVNKHNLVKIKHWNARSLNAKHKKGHKSASFCDFAINHKLDIFAVTETWFTGGVKDHRTLADIGNTLPNFKLHHVPRTFKRAGGVGVLIRDGVSFNINDSPTYKAFEHMDVTVQSNSTSMRLVVIYRPPENSENQLTFRMFLDDFSTLLESLVVIQNLLIIGDLNVHVDDTDDREAALFSNLLELSGLQQHITGPTDEKGHTLDLIISRKDDDLVMSPSTHHDLPSDHSAIKCFVNMLRPAPSVKRVETRRIRSIDTETFTKDIHESVLLTSPSDELEDLAHQFSTTLSDILDTHAPLLQRSVILRPHAPWYTDTLRAAKQEKRRLERKWLKSKQFKQQCIQYKDLLNKAKNEFHRSQITDSEPKDLFRVVDKLSSPKPEETLPSYDCPKALADSFAQFFVDKVKNFVIA